jgi:excisionase family DNA binding protein
MEKETYTVKELVDKLGIGLNKAYELVNSGKIPSIKVGKKYLIPKMALENWLEQCLAERM